MAFTPEEKGKIRRHMGYAGVAAAPLFVLGNPAAMEPNFLLESAMDALINTSEEIVRAKFLPKLDSLADMIFDNADGDAVKSVGDIEINPDDFLLLVRRYRYWQGELGNALQVGPNPFDYRFRGMGINVPVG